MKELIRKSVLLGLGAASLTKEKVDNLVAELVKRKAINTKDGRWIAKQVLNDLARNKKRLERLSAIHAEILGKKAKKLEKALMERGSKTAKRLLKKAEKGL